MKIVTMIIIVLLASIHTNSIADNTNPRFKAVQMYLTQGDDYPELFNNNQYRIKVEGVAIGDLDTDGEDEVVLQVKPHYRQSPTIIIFRVDNNMNVTRVIEGLAPGPLKPLSGDYLDSHTLGLGVDIEIKKNENKFDASEMFKEFGGVVEYDNWYHLDYRSGKKMYIDMSHAKVPDNRNNCESFEFSPVKHIQIAPQRGKQGVYLLAYIDKTVYSYKIKKFLKNGLMEKVVEVNAR